MCYPNDDFRLLCLEKIVLRNTLRSLHETRGDVLEKKTQATVLTDLQHINNLEKETAVSFYRV